MTEEEAKTKACCAKLGLGFHNETWMPNGAACIGSRCMAWRWEDDPKEDMWFGGKDETPPEYQYGEWKWDEAQGVWTANDADAEGFCGLAGPNP